MKKQILALIVSAIIALCTTSPTVAMELPDATEKLRQLKQFQQKLFFDPPEEWKKKLRDKNQALLSAHQSKILTSLAVENIAEVAQILATILPSSDVHYVGLMDLDETLLFGGGLGWVDCSFSKCNTRIQTESLTQLLLNYGFSSFEEFREWGNTTFPTPGVQKCGYDFFGQKSVIDSKIPGILESWHTQGMNIFGITARDDEKSNRAYTQQTLKEAGINFEKLTRRVLDNKEIPFVCRQCLDSGVIYSPIYGKFGPTGAGIKFLDTYLEKFSKQKSPLPPIEIIVVDEWAHIFSEIAAPSNIKALEDLGEKFKTKITLRYFQPYEHYWLCPYEQWNDFPSYGCEINRNKKSLQALQEFLETFKTRPEKPAPGPFYINGIPFTALFPPLGQG